MFSPMKVLEMAKERGKDSLGMVALIGRRK
jgi:hypothetical protein